MNQEELKDKKRYEVAVLLKAEEFAPEVAKFLEQHEVEIREAGPLKKINLGYPIKKTTQAYFGYFHVLALPSSIAALDKDFKTQQSVLRSLIVNVPKQKPGTSEGSRERRPFMRKPMSVPMGEIKPPRKPLSNEAIEKKIEEILQ